MGRKREGERITKSVIATAKPKTSDYTIWDLDQAGFGLRVRPSGTKRFVYYYRNALGQQRRMTIGDAKSLKLEDVRTTVRNLAGQVANHIDPSEHRIIEKERYKAIKAAADDPKEDRFSELATRYIAENDDLGDKYRYDAGRWLRKDINPTIGDIQIHMLTKDNVQDMVDDIAKTRSTTARRCGEVVSSILTWAKTAKILEDDFPDPSKHLSLPKQNLVDNALREKNLAQMWEAIEEEAEVSNGVVTGYAFDVIRLALLTGARKGELRKLKHHQVDLDRGVLIFQRHEHKTGKVIKEGTGIKVVILPAAAIELIRPHCAADDDRDYVFHGKNLNEPVSDTQTSKVWGKVRARARKKKGFPQGQLRFHDLRHTFASMGLAMGTPLADIGKMLGHSNPTTTLRYVHHDINNLKKSSDQIAARMQNQMIVDKP
ncbi:tyrosine-type recombinase/integrase [Magnetovibrio sp. PR-2]|uniref:tyrosine-type recombinase/integrase n=1 Tax=Magnetovibrio sp. PR-2 TaxID=3120356 RepID=UPI002FCE101C